MYTLHAYFLGNNNFKGGASSPRNLVKRNPYGNKRLGVEPLVSLVSTKYVLEKVRKSLASLPTSSS